MFRFNSQNKFAFAAKCAVTGPLFLTCIAVALGAAVAAAGVYVCVQLLRRLRSRVAVPRPAPNAHLRVALAELKVE